MKELEVEKLKFQELLAANDEDYVENIANLDQKHAASSF